jgi:hypothetical protein
MTPNSGNGKHVAPVMSIVNTYLTTSQALLVILRSRLQYVSDARLNVTVASSLSLSLFQTRTSLTDSM